MIKLHVRDLINLGPVLLFDIQDPLYKYTFRFNGLFDHTYFNSDREL